MESTERAGVDSALYAAGTARRVVSGTSKAVRRKKLEIREKQAEQKARAEARRDTESAPAGKLATPEERMKQAAVREKREQAKNPRFESFRGEESPAQANTGTVHHPSAASGCKGNPAKQGGGPTIREKPATPAPKTKPPLSESTIRTKQVMEQATAKPPNTVKTSKPVKSPAKRAADKARKEMERQGRKQAVQTAKQAAKAAAEVTKKIAQAVAKAVSALVGALAGSVGGIVLLVLILLVIVVAAIGASPFGIFFSGEEQAADAVAPREAIQTVNEEYIDRLDEVKSGDYDRVETTGYCPTWKDVMAVFAVKTAGADDGVDVTAFDADRVERLKNTFWDMTDISARSETVELPAESEAEDDEESEPDTETVLYVTITAKTTAEMADEYHFSRDQNAQLAELLDPENNEFWMALLYGSAAADGDIVAVALSQIGNVGGGPYWSWYGFSGRVEWCACFVSWCADQCGYIGAGIVPRFSGCSVGVSWFKSRGQWMDRTAEPVPGAIIFFDWYDPVEGQDGNPDHVGIVEKVENGRVYTIEGNSGNACRENSYPIGYFEIYGYGCPAYN